MTTDRQRFLVDHAGNRVAVLLDIDEYERLLDELDPIRASPSGARPCEVA